MGLAQGNGGKASQRITENHKQVHELDQKVISHKNHSGALG